MRTGDNSTNDWPSRRTGITIRYAFPDDHEALVRLAALDSQPVPAGPLLVAEVDGELQAAVAIGGDAALGDPFRPTAELIALLRQRAAQLAEMRQPSRWARIKPNRAGGHTSLKPG